MIITPETLALSLLKNHLAAGLASAGYPVDISIGWIGNKPFPAGDHRVFISLEETAPRVDHHEATVIAFTVPASNAAARSEVTIDFGSEELPVVVNIYATSKHRGPDLRDDCVSRISALFTPEPGYPPGITFFADIAQKIPVRFDLENRRIVPAPEGIAREEWRAVLNLTARFPATGTRTFNFCREIILTNEPLE